MLALQPRARVALEREDEVPLIEGDAHRRVGAADHGRAAVVVANLARVWACLEVAVRQLVERAIEEVAHELHDVVLPLHRPVVAQPVEQQASGQSSARTRLILTMSDMST